MKNVGTIGILHVIFLTMTVIGLKNHVTIIPPLLQFAGRDGWISVLLATIATIPWIFLLVYIHNKSNQEPLKDWLKQKIGKIGSSIFLYSTVSFLIVLAAFTMVETLEWISTTFLPKTPILLLLIIYTILCILLVTTNLQTIVIVNVFVLFGVIILGFFVAFTNIQVKDYELLRPFFEHGFQPVFKGMLYPMSGFAEILLFLFLQHQFKDKIRWYHFLIILVILMGLTMGPLLGAIAEFGPIEAANQRYPAYEEWGLAFIGRFVEHLDFFSIYQWLTGTFIRVGLLLFIATDLLNMTKDNKKVWKYIAAPFFFMCLILILLSNPIFLKMKGNYLLIFTFFFILILSLFLTMVSLIKNQQSKRGNDKNLAESGEE